MVETTAWMRHSTNVVGLNVMIRRRTGANLGILVAGLITALIALVTFVFTNVINEPATIVTLVVIFVASVIFDFLWSRPTAATAATSG